MTDDVYWRGAKVADRYALYGIIAEGQEQNKEPMTLEEQSIGQSGGGTLIYETDDVAEARAIFDAGGFERSGVWHVVTRVEDRNIEKSVSTDIPAALKPPVSRPLSKEDFQ